MELRIDHVAFGWSDREAIADHFSSLGLTPDYGGTHRDGTTEMSLVGFDDGSYLELIGPTGEGRPARWPEFIQGNAGPAAWAIRADDVAELATRMIDRGMRVNGPIHDHRARPDGTRVEWDHCLFGVPAWRRALPFAVTDRTPREYRTSPTDSVANGPLRGIAEVVIGVEDLDAAVARFRRIFRLPVPTRTTHGDFGATLAHFPGQPLTLAEPSGHSWLRPRLQEFGRAPVAVLFETGDMTEAMSEYSLTRRDRWFNSRYATLDSETIGYRVGVIER